MKANSKELFQKSFSFPEISKNDEVLAILSDLDIAQGNLNENPDNEGLLQKYISTAQIATKNLGKQFAEFWTNPGAEIMLAEKKAAKESEDADE